MISSVSHQLWVQYSGLSIAKQMVPTKIKKRIKLSNCGLVAILPHRIRSSLSGPNMHRELPLSKFAHLSSRPEQNSSKLRAAAPELFARSIACHFDLAVEMN